MYSKQDTEMPPAYSSAPPPVGWKGPEEMGQAAYPMQPGVAYYSDAGYPAANMSAAPPQAPFIPGHSAQRIDYPQGQMLIVNAENGNGEGASFAFSNKAIRLAFIRKVFLILTAQLLVTTLICGIFYSVNDVRFFLIRHSYLYYVGYAVFLITYFCLVCCRGCARKTPGNYIALMILTLAMSYMMATVTSFYHIESIMIAFGITVALTISLTIFAWQTKIDFTMCSGVLFCLVLVLFFTGIACSIWAMIAGWSRAIMVVYGGVGAFVFSVFLVYDVQKVIGGKKYELSPEEYVYGAVQIYLDVVYIFLMLLNITGRRN